MEKLITDALIKVISTNGAIDPLKIIFLVLIVVVSVLIIRLVRSMSGDAQGFIITAVTALVLLVAAFMAFGFLFG